MTPGNHGSVKDVGVNARGLRIGEYHGRAKLSDAAVREIRAMLAKRLDFIASGIAAGTRMSAIHRALKVEGLSYAHIASQFSVSKSQIRWIAIGRQRVQAPTKWKSCRDGVHMRP